MGGGLAKSSGSLLNHCKVKLGLRDYEKNLTMQSLIKFLGIYRKYKKDQMRYLTLLTGTSRCAASGTSQVIG